MHHFSKISGWSSNKWIVQWYVLYINKIIIKKIYIHSIHFWNLCDIIGTKSNEGKSIIKAFVRRNKTAPLPVEQSIECESLSRNLTPSAETLAGEKSTQTMTTILDPLNLNIDYSQSYASTNLVRPYTAPERSQRLLNKMIINIPGQVPQWQHL